MTLDNTPEAVVLDLTDTDEFDADDLAEFFDLLFGGSFDADDDEGWTPEAWAENVRGIRMDLDAAYDDHPAPSDRELMILDGVAAQAVEAGASEAQAILIAAFHTLNVPDFYNGEMAMLIQWASDQPETEDAPEEPAAPEETPEETPTEA